MTLLLYLFIWLISSFENKNTSELIFLFSSKLIKRLDKMELVSLSKIAHAFK